ncbi:MAG: glycosyltransferase [Lachnospiraceae bacterium]|nr:glycosyltransferase [Lachnospiraceae bacterium]
MDYKLSVIFITYNHAKYVEKALMSVINQKTDFPFEVVVGDDCSTDGTQDILKRIASGHPEVKLNLRSENTGGRPTLNVYETTKKCTGQYLAYLEGDDFWTDDHKLQKQVDFLEDHPEYTACTHSMKMVDENDEDITDPETLSIGSLYDWSGDFTYEDYCYSGKWPGHYASVVSRNIYKARKYDYTILYRASDFTDDALINLFLLMEGKIYRMDEVMSVWRYVKKSGAGNWNSIAMKRNIARDDCYLSKTMMQWIEQYRPLSDYSRKRCLADFGLALKEYLKRPNAENKQFLRDMYEYGITHVVLKDKKSSLLGYSVRYITDKVFGKN